MSADLDPLSIETLYGDDGTSQENDQSFMLSVSSGYGNPNFIATDQQWVVQTDTQQGNYSAGQVTFDFNPLVSSTRYIDMRRAILTIPITMYCQLVNSDGVTAPANYVLKPFNYGNRMAMSVKGSALHFINGLTVQCQNQTVVPLQNMSNLYNVYKCISSFNANDLDSYAAVMNMTKDLSSSMFWHDAFGEMNVLIGPSKQVAQMGFEIQGASTIYYDTSPLHLNLCANTGRLARNAGFTVLSGGRPIGFKPLGFFGAGGSADDPLVGAISCTMVDSTSINMLQLDYVDIAAPAGISGSPAPNIGGIAYTFNAKIPLRYVHDFFSKVPMLKATLFQMTIYTHLPVSGFIPCQCTTGGDGGNVKMAPQTYDTTKKASVNSLNGFMPIQLSVLSTYLIGATAGTASTAALFNETGLSLTSGTLPTTTDNFGFIFGASIGNTYLKQCTVDVPMVELSPEAERLYKDRSKKTIRYNDIIRAAPAGLQNIPPGNSVNAQLTAGLGCLRKVVLFSFLPANTQATPGASGNGFWGVSSLNSPFTSAGSTVAYGTQLYNYNTIVGGKPLYDSNLTFVRQTFIRNMLGDNVIAGNMIDGVRGHLYSFADWNGAYGYKTTNLSRKPAVQDRIPTQIDSTFSLATNAGTSGTTNSYGNGTRPHDQGPNVSYYAFIEVEKTFTIDAITGQLLSGAAM